MSELKAFRIIQGDTGGYGAPSYKCDTDGNRIEEWSDACEVYDRFEADKVIAEKDAEIERLEILCANYRHDCDNLAISNEQVKRSAQTLRKKMNYQKYKRCVATADLCFREYQTYCALIERGEECFSEMDFYGRWNKIWLILAEKFKEAK